MQEAALTARPRKSYRVVTTDSNHSDPVAPNRLARQFDVSGIGLDRVWFGDITYLPTREGPLYLATILDLGSRRCVGWAMRDSLEGDLTLNALRMAIEARRPADAVNSTLTKCYDSDRGRTPG